MGRNVWNEMLVPDKPSPALRTYFRLVHHKPRLDNIQSRVAGLVLVHDDDVPPPFQCYPKWKDMEASSNWQVASHVGEPCCVMLV